MPPRHIVLLVSSMGPGGAERVAATLSNAWVRRGDRVTLVATYSRPCQSFYRLDPAVRFVSVSALPQVRGARPLRAFRRFAALRGLLRSERPDVVVSFLTTVNIKALFASIGLGVPLVMAEHTYPPGLPEGWLAGALRRVTYPRAACLAMLTQEGRLWAQGAVPGVRTVVIPNPVVYPMPDGEPVLEVERLVPDTRPIILAAGRLDAGKQYEHLIEAFGRLAPGHPDWRLVVLGDGPNRSALEGLIAQLGLIGRVVMPGRAGNMTAWYQRASVFAMTSRYEGFPMVLCEALAHGVPAVSYDCDTGPRDMIEDGVNGLLVPPRDGVDGLTRALSTLVDSPERRRAMSGRAESHRQRFSVDAVLARWDAVFETVTRPGADIHGREPGVGRPAQPQP